MIKLINLLYEVITNKILIPRRSPEERQKGAIEKDIEKIEKYIKNGSKGDLILAKTKIKHLPESLKIIKGDLNLQESLIESLPDNLTVMGELNLAYANNIMFLPKNLKVGKDLWLGNKINHLPKDIIVEGTIHLPSDWNREDINNEDYPGVKSFELNGDWLIDGKWKLRERGWKDGFGNYFDENNNFKYNINHYTGEKTFVKWTEENTIWDPVLRRDVLRQENNINENKILIKKYILENTKLGKQYVSQGKLSEEDLKKLIEIDPTPAKKFVGWISKIWINEKPNIDILKNTIREYNVFLNKNKVKTKDINQFKSFKDLQSEVNDLNQSGKGKSQKDKESDYETIIDNSDLLIISPHTHEASRKLGLTYFAFRDCGKGKKDSAWCTTYKAPDHFDDYYYDHNVTFYYIKVKSSEMIENLKEAFPGPHNKDSKLEKYKAMTVVALVIIPNDSNNIYPNLDANIEDILYDGNLIDGYDGLDTQMSSEDIKKFINIIGIS